MDKLSYGGWPNCIKLSNGEMEVVVTTDVGPRIIRCGFIGGANLLKEYKEQMGRTGDKEWLLYGGHRLWHAPESIPRTYWPDNIPVKAEMDGSTLKLTQPLEQTTRIEKQIEITLDAKENHATVLHRLINRNLWDVKLAPWAMSVMAAGGRAIYPQEKFIPHSEHLLPARPLVLWHYTNMADPRWNWGDKYIQLKQDPNATTNTKVGFLNTPGWTAYVLGEDVMVKRFRHDPDGEYPDYGCNTETYTDSDMLEVETLGALVNLAPGACAEFTEHWILGKAEVGCDEASIDSNLMPLVRSSDKYIK
jgi:hypothetical protein